MKKGAYHLLQALERHAINLKKLCSRDPRFGIGEQQVTVDRKALRELLSIRDLDRKVRSPVKSGRRKKS